MEPAAIISGRRRKLIVADLHLGILKINQPELVEKLIRIAKNVKADEIVINGDLKHNIGVKKFEERIIEEFITKLNDAGYQKDDIYVIKGNHDGNIEKLIGAYSPRGIRIGKFGILHGHAYPSDDVLEAKTIIVAHTHPAILLKDEVGGLKRRVWLEGVAEILGDKRKIIVMPAFNELCASTSVNIDKPAGVFFRKWNYFDAEVTLLDGVYLGRLKIFK